MDRIFLYTDDNLIGQSIHRYLVDNNKDITTFRYQDITQGAIAPLSGIVIFNVIHKDFSAANTMLLLNNMRITDVEGSLFGHQTQFDLGVNFNTSTRLKYFAKIEYSYTSYPRFNEPERIRLHYADLRVGVRF